MIDDKNLLPEVHLIDNYIQVIEFLVDKLAKDSCVMFLNQDFFEQILVVKSSIQQLRLLYINSLKFQNYE